MAASRYDNLKNSLARWRQSLAAHEALTPERIRELDCHLRETLTDIHARGITAQEAFEVATRRVGAAAELSEQFAAADPASLWRGRVFWMVLGVLVVQTIFLLQALIRFFIFDILTDPNGALHGWAPALGSKALTAFFVFSPVILIIVVMVAFVRLARGRWAGLARGLEKLCFRRGPFAWRLFFWATLPSLILLALQILTLAASGPDHGSTLPALFLIPVLLMTLLSLTLGILAAKFAPQQFTPSRD